MIDTRSSVQSAGITRQGAGLNLGESRVANWNHRYSLQCPEYRYHEATVAR